MGQINPTLPVAGSTLNNIADPEVATALQQIVTLVNGNVDLTNLSAAAVQALQASTAPLSSHSTIAASESRTNTAYGTMPTADQVIGLVLPANGLIAVGYHATWQQSVATSARAAIFLNATQLKYVSGSAPVVQEAVLNIGTTGSNFVLASGPTGLASSANPGYSGDVTTGQIAGGIDSVSVLAASGAGSVGGPVTIFAAAGTYTVSVQFKAFPSGTVTVSNRKLWVQVLPFG